MNGNITDGASSGAFDGPPAQWVSEIIELAESQRFDTFIFWGEGDGQLDRFAQEVVPAVRERLSSAG